ncbi:MAG: hypothetical protein QM530_02155 [Phycisphaerales bacterium]|nr:hypothetical protein [Phycisphaerales bacterium]
MTKTIIFSFSILFSQQLAAQGCSDAGFCTIGSFRNHSSAQRDSLKQKFTVLLGNGIGDECVYVMTPSFQYDNRLTEQWSLQAKVTTNFASGNLASLSGLGDLYLASSYMLKSKAKWKYTLTAAFKIPLNSGDLKVNSKPLPMLYQSSLGTFDFIGGLTLSNSHWVISAAIQQPLTGANKNTFLPSKWTATEAQKYIPSNAFKRKTDGLIKATYRFKSAKKWDISAGVLAIYHFGKDAYTDATDKVVELNGSDGLTLNATSIFYYTINPKMLLGLSVAAPFVVREIRPDGLTRAFVLSPEFVFKF